LRLRREDEGKLADGLVQLACSKWITRFWSEFLVLNGQLFHGLEFGQGLAEVFSAEIDLPQTLMGLRVGRI